MIKNIIFDMGEVLIRFDRDLFIARLGISGEDAALLKREVFLSLEWAMMDRGALTDAEAAARMCARLPERLHDAALKLATMWDRPILPIEGMYELIEELDQKGYGIWLLSNASYHQHDYWPRIPASRFFRDTLISADVKLMKPQPEIFKLACEKFGIAMDESVFIDDATYNCEAAIWTGLDAIVFRHDVKELRAELRKRGVDVAEA